MLRAEKSKPDAGAKVSSSGGTASCRQAGLMLHARPPTIACILANTPCMFEPAALCGKDGCEPRADGHPPGIGRAGPCGPWLEPGMSLVRPFGALVLNR